MSAPTTLTYAAVLRLPGAVPLLLWTVVGKTSFAMVTLALLLLIQSDSDGFAASGAAAGAFATGNVIIAPLRARLVDRFGARPIMTTLAAGYAVGLVCVIVANQQATGTGTVVVISLLTGVCTPPLGAVARGIWARLSPTDEYRTRAYSLDAVVEELVFIVGPLLVGALVLLSNGPVIAVATAALCGLAGTIGVVCGPVPPRIRATGATWSWSRVIGPLRIVRFWPILLSLGAVGFVLGAAELLATANGQTIGDAGAGLLLASFAAGSAVGGLIYGTRSWRGSALWRMLALASGSLVALALTAASTGLAYQLAMFAVMGLFVSPSLVAGYLAADDVAPLSERTEASALINTAVNAGAAVVLALGAVLLDQLSLGWASVWMAVGGLGLLCLAAVAHGVERRVE